MSPRQTRRMPTPALPVTRSVGAGRPDIGQDRLSRSLCRSLTVETVWISASGFRRNQRIPLELGDEAARCSRSEVGSAALDVASSGWRAVFLYSSRHPVPRWKLAVFWLAPRSGPVAVLP